MRRLLEYKGYHAKFEFSVDDDTFVGKIVGIQDSIVFDGNTVEEIKKAFRESVDDYIELCREIGKSPEKEYKGTFNVRIPSELHKKAAIEAERHGISLNQFIQQSIERELDRRNRPEPLAVMITKDFQKYKPISDTNIFTSTNFNQEEDLTPCLRTAKLQSFVS